MHCSKCYAMQLALTAVRPMRVLQWHYGHMAQLPPQ